MRKVFDSISHINLHTSLIGSDNQTNNDNNLNNKNNLDSEKNFNKISTIYIPVKNKIILYSSDLKKLSEISVEDEILNFHLAKDNIVIVGKGNKKITLVEADGKVIAE